MLFDFESLNLSGDVIKTTLRVFIIVIHYCHAIVSFQRNSKRIEFIIIIKHHRLKEMTLITNTGMMSIPSMGNLKVLNQVHQATLGIIDCTFRGNRIVIIVVIIIILIVILILLGFLIIIILHFFVFFRLRLRLWFRRRLSNIPIFYLHLKHFTKSLFIFCFFALTLRLSRQSLRFTLLFFQLNTTLLCFLSSTCLFFSNFFQSSNFELFINIIFSQYTFLLNFPHG
mmetsp:Transcript_13348/g.21870  ORF Transcript_13348/g.21870 Transcript_13348/m.21870 type:complete len:227 (-) Transcript_13348:1972-2652(-)